MEPDLQNEWNVWWEEQYKAFFSDTLPVQDMTSQQTDTFIAPDEQNFVPEEQNYESWTSNEEIKSLLVTIGSRLDKIEAVVHENKNLSNQACDGVRALEHGIGVLGEAVEKLRKNLSGFSRCLYRLLIGGPSEEGGDMEFT